MYIIGGQIEDVHVFSPLLQLISIAIPLSPRQSNPTMILINKNKRFDRRDIRRGINC